jgi:uncharacterized membrane protein
VLRGALWGVGAAGLLVPRLETPQQLLVFGAGALCGALAGLRWPGAESLRHPWLAAAAALAGVAMTRLAEPTFFLLVPLVAASVAWPLGGPPPEEKPLPRYVVPAIFLAAAAVFFAQSAHRHWTFGSGSRDLGLFYQTHWLIAHGWPLLNTVMGMPVFADHMTFDDFLVAPLLRVHDSAATLLFVQAVAVASAVFPLYDAARRLTGRPRGALALPLAWVLAPDVHMGVMFDYNQTPFASALLAWTAWALLFRGVVAVALTVTLTCAAKGNFCLYVAVLALVLSWRGVARLRAAAVAGAALTLFAVEIAVLAPWYREGGFRHWEYEDLGAGPSEIATSIVTRPHQAVALAVDDPRKRRGLLQPVVTAGFLPCADPLTLALLVPNWAERFLSSHRTRWWGYYYGMPAVATALVGAALGWARLRAARRDGRRLPAYLVGCVILTAVCPPYTTHDGDRRDILLRWDRAYASPPEDVRTQRAAVAFIGKDPRLKVAAQYHLLPHLAGRPEIYELTRAAEADVVALQLNGGTWPEGRPSWRRRVRETWDTGLFHVGFCQGRTVVLYRGRQPGVECPVFADLLRRP